MLLLLLLLQLMVVRKSVQLEWSEKAATAFEIQLNPWLRMRNDLPYVVSIRIEVELPFLYVNVLLTCTSYASAQWLS